MNKNNNILRIVAQKESNGSWQARCLEFDLVFQGKTVEELQERIIDTLKEHIELDRRKGRETFSTRKPAPKEFEVIFNSIRTAIIENEILNSYDSKLAVVG